MIGKYFAAGKGSVVDRNSVVERLVDMCLVGKYFVGKYSVGMHFADKSHLDMRFVGKNYTSCTSPEIKIHINF